ncbi:hypothetical protein ACU6T4_09115 [Avibacterium paragallinarum]|uniref:hypothetical protein n=1 Tax=Avibacterium paragallinarum TaxID=728 RepID=UPI00021AD5A6|nr:hypothetical protein [Avibacterium paragallinarum]AZI13548.1 hypothetical protein EIA51_02175 [Avibacterium paragallinarum]QIR10869.1 hypothetical protein HBL79_00520 [Avibacterium paragallinarum]QJE10278.1 hypothetical protein HHJ62_08265 [Avibacterium paragallinarum]QJE12472.1 hypothetical protein HHJ61_08275 [Avibacterium paragallinarum]QJE14675.1 hypothetical protein HHJ60_08290 [Avibacterium paragallinarum]
MSVEWNGENAIQELATKLEQLAKRDIAVGIPAEDNAVLEEGFNLATLAAVLEFGSADKRIPARPFLTQTLKENTAKYTALYREGINNGEDAHHLLSKIAQIAQADVQKNIEQGDWAKNAPSTIKRKKSSKPLIDTGRLGQSIKGVVR